MYQIVGSAVKRFKTWARALQSCYLSEGQAKTMLSLASPINYLKFYLRYVTFFLAVIVPYSLRWGRRVMLVL